MGRIKKEGHGRDPGVIPLDDLAPRKDPKGGRRGSARMVFGERPIVTGQDEAEEVVKNGGEKVPPAPTKKRK
jgi:hypothetical protein